MTITFGHLLFFTFLLALSVPICCGIALVLQWPAIILKVGSSVCAVLPHLLVLYVFQLWKALPCWIWVCHPIQEMCSMRHLSSYTSFTLSLTMQR